MSKALIIADTRDKKPWNFPEDDLLSGTIRKKVDYGDYTIEGLEHLIFLERKASAAELATNMTEKRFHKLMTMGAEFKYKYIIVECPFKHLLEYPRHENMPKQLKDKVRLPANLLISYFVSVMVKYGIHVLFADDAKGAQQLALRLLRQICRNERKE